MSLKSIIRRPSTISERLAQATADFIYEHGLKRVLIAPVSLFALSVGLGVPLTSGGWQLLFIGLGIIFYASLIIALLLERRQRNFQEHQKSKVLNMYTERLFRQQRENRDYFRYLEFDEFSSVSRDGSIEIQRYCTIETIDDAVPAVWSLVSKSPVHKSSNTKIVPKFTCRTFHGTSDKPHPGNVIPEDERLLGGSIVHTFRKENEESYIGFAHLDTPASPGETLYIYFKWTWPKFCEELIETGREPMHWRLGQRANYFRARMRFDKDFKASQLTTSPYGGTSPKKSVQPDGSVEYTVSVNNLEPGLKFGFVVDTENS